MACARCNADVEVKPGKWCADCERAYDKWVRTHASDVVWAVLGGGLVLAAVGMIVPLLGIDWILSTPAALVGWGTLFGLHRLARRRRRRQFLAGAPLPRAYLPPPR